MSACCFSGFKAPLLREVAEAGKVTHLQKTECPEVLRHFWSGHAPKHVSERYTKLLNERDFRLEWAEKVGLGFDLPVPVGQLGQLHVVPKVA